MIALVIIVAVIVCGVWANWVAPRDRQTTFFLLGLLLGPVGVLGAALAQPRPVADKSKPRAIADGRTRCQCALCGAESDLHDPKGFTCWRCGERSYINTTVMKVKL
jgi:hypothetical protein